jgi:hypothetical protein
MKDTQEKPTAAIAVKEDAPLAAKGEVLDAVPVHRLSWAEIDAMLLDWTKTQPLTLDEIAEAAAHLPPLTQAQLDEMTITQIGEYATKAFRLCELAHKTFAQWMEAHWLMVMYIHDKTTAQGRRLPTPNYPSWGEVIRRAFPTRSIHTVNHTYYKLLAKWAGKEKAAAKAKKKGAQEDAQPAPVAEKPESHWEEDFAELPSSDMAAIIHAALKHNEYDFADVTSSLNYNERMSLLSNLLDCFACTKETAKEVRETVALAYRTSKDRKKAKAAHKAAVKEYDESAPEREKVRKEEARKPKKTAKKQGGNGEVQAQGGNGEQKPVLSVSNPPFDPLDFTSGPLGSSLG